MTPITDDELARRIVATLDFFNAMSAGALEERLYWSTRTAILRRLRALRDEGLVVEVAGPRGSLWRLP